MLDLAGGTTVYLSCGVTDLRKSYNGLAAIIKLKFHLDPYSRCMFAFCNRRRTSIKILQWDGSGFWILMKRLDHNTFHWPDTPDELRQVTLKEIHSSKYLHYVKRPMPYSILLYYLYTISVLPWSFEMSICSYPSCIVLHLQV